MSAQHAAPPRPSAQSWRPFARSLPWQRLARYTRARGDSAHRQRWRLLRQFARAWR